MAYVEYFACIYWVRIKNIYENTSTYLAKYYHHQIPKEQGLMLFNVKSKFERYNKSSGFAILPCYMTLTVK